MAKKQEADLKDLRNSAQEGKAIFGASAVMKKLRQGGLSRIFVARNCPEKILEEANHYAKLAGVPVIEVEQSNEELGVLCKKNFFISIVGVTVE